MTQSRRPIRSSSVRATVLASAIWMACQPAMAATSVWGSAMDGFWDVVENWLPAPPAAGDDVRIEGARTVTWRTGELELASLHAPDAHLIINGDGAPFIWGPATLGQLSIQGNWFSGQGVTTVRDLFVQEANFNGYASGQLTVTGHARFDGATTNHFDVAKGMLLQGPATWSAGNGRLTMLGNPLNTSNLTIGAGSVFVDEGAADASGSKLLGTNTTRHRLINAGVLERRGLGTTAISGAFDNTGVVRVQSGELAIGQSTHTGKMVIDAPGTLTVGYTPFQNPVRFTSGSVLQNDGLLNLQGGELLIEKGALYQGGGSIQTRMQGRLKSQVALRLDKLSLVTGGLQSTEAIEVNTLELAGSLTAPTIDVRNHASLSGDVSGTLEIHGTATLRSLTVDSVRIHEGATMQDVGRPERGNLIGLDGKLENNGTFIRSEGAGTRVFKGDVINNGTMALRAGSSTFEAGLRNEGLLQVEGSTLEISNGDRYEGNGLLHIGQASVLQVSSGHLRSNLVLDQASIVIHEGATIEALDHRIDNISALTGAGTLIGTLVNQNGRLRPGRSWDIDGATLTVKGDVLLGSGSILELDIGYARDTDLFEAEGAMKLGGALLVNVANPGLKQGQELVLARFGELLDNSRFDTFTVNSVTPYTWQLIYGDQDVRLRVLAVPEPGTWGFMGLGLLGIVAAGRRRARH